MDGVDLKPRRRLEDAHVDRRDESGPTDDLFMNFSPRRRHFTGAKQDDLSRKSTLKGGP